MRMYVVGKYRRPQGGKNIEWKGGRGKIAAVMPCELEERSENKAHYISQRGAAVNTIDRELSTYKI